MTLMKDTDDAGRSPTYYWVLGGHPREVVWGGPLGMFESFSDPSGGGMVVIHKVAELVEVLGKKSAFYGKPHPNFRYMEITRMGLLTITYFGDASVYEP